MSRTALYLLVLVSSVSSAPSVKTNAKVLILGGGAAGLAAAKTLSDNKIEDFIILEGSERIGGRVKSVPFAGKTVEAGANWIVGKKGNPLYDVSQNINLQGKWSNWDNVIIRNSDGEDVTDSEGETAWSRLEEAHVNMEKLLERLGERNDDMSSRSCLAIGGWQPKTPVDNVVEIYDYDYEYGGTPDVSSCASLNQTLGIVKEVFYVGDKRGYEYVLKTYAEDAVTDNDPRLRLNEVVTSIKYTGSKVQVRTENKNVYTADFAIVTFSIGVMKSGSVKFKPPLPKWKSDRLFRVRSENFFGIYLKFPDSFTRFWDETEFILYASEKRGYFPVWQNLEAEGLSPAGTNILEIMTVGEEADRVSRLSNDEVKAELMEMLRRVYKDKNIPDPEDIFIPNWRTDPLFLGSFANIEAGAARHEILDAISAPVGRLYFAGDAYDPDHIGYVLGAIRSGVRTAEEITEKLK